MGAGSGESPDDSASAAEAEKMEAKQKVVAGCVFVWADFSEFQIESLELFGILLHEYKVFLAPGQSFYCDERESFNLRLSYACVSRDLLDIGLQRLARFVR